MPLFYSKNIVARVPEPPNCIHPSLKDDEWHKKWAYYIYGIGADIANDISTKNSVLRSYANGKQDTQQYKTILDDELETTENVPDEIYSRNQQQIRQDRTGLTHINYAQVFNPMPIYIQTILGLFEDSNYSLRCYAENEYSNNDRDVLKYRKQLLKDFPDALQKIGSDEFVPKNQIELDMLIKLGGFKLPYEVACEKLFDMTEELSDSPQVRRKILKDLIEIRRAAAYAELENGSIRYKYVDVDNTLIEYSSESGYENSRYWAVYQEMTIQDLREETGWDEVVIREIANSVVQLFDNKTFQKQNPEDIRYYDSYRIPVLRNYFRSTDTNYFDERVNKAGEFIRKEILWQTTQPEMRNSGGTKTVKEDIQRIYKNTWIIGTEKVFGCGIYANEAFDYKNNRPLPPLIMYQMPVETSIVENSIPALDQIAITYYKFQNNIAMAAPAGMAYDLNLLENTSFDGKDWSPLDLIDMRTKTGSFVYRSTPTGGAFQGGEGGGNLPIATQSEAMYAINEATASFNMWFKNLSVLTGLDQYTLLSKTPSSDTTATAINASAASTSATLRPILEGWSSIHRKLFYTVIYLVQGHILDDDIAYERYSNKIGKELMGTLKVACEKEPLVIGIKSVQSPSSEMKQEIIGAARAAMQPKDGVSALSMGEYLFIINELMNNSGIEHARLILSHREQVAEETRLKNSQDNIKLQQQGNAQLKQIEQQTEIMKMGLQALNDFNKAKWQAYFKAELENQGVANAIMQSTYDKTIEAMINGQIPPPQQQAPQQAMAQQPQQMGQEQMQGQQPQQDVGQQSMEQSMAQ